MKQTNARKVKIVLFIMAVLALILFTKMDFSLKTTMRNNLVLYQNCEESGVNIEKNCLVDTPHSVCFLGKRFCHPGYTGIDCETKLIPANPWYTDHCPNLEQDITIDVNMPLSMLSNGSNCPRERFISGVSRCAYFCFSHPVSGVVQIPLSFWQVVQKNENDIWRATGGSDDRGGEHLKGFNNYKALPNNLGNYIEVGCGPFTQTQFIIKREFSRISLLDPGADSYIKNVPSCRYKNGTLIGKNVRILSIGAEKLLDDEYYGQYDTLLAINVIEHVWDGYQFLSNMYNALKKGGILIYHDRFYPYPSYGDAVLGYGNLYHPIRLTRVVYEHLFKHFETVYMFEGQTPEQIRRAAGEVGFYFIGKKL